MTRDEFITLFNEKPEDLLGQNWECFVDNYLFNKYEQLIKGDFYE